MAAFLQCSLHVYRPIVLLVAAFALGIWAGDGVSWTAGAVLFIGSFAAGSVHRRVPFWLLIACAFLLGVWRGSSLPLLPHGSRLPAYPAVVHGRITRPPLRLGPAPVWRFSLDAGGRALEAFASFRPHLPTGQRVRVTGTFAPLWYARNPGDGSRFRQNRGRRAIGRITVKAEAQITAIQGPPSWLDATRRRVRAQLRGLYPADIHGLALGLFLGDRRAVTAEQKECFRRAGTAHLLAISGLHVGLVAFALYGLLRRLGSGRPTVHGAALVASALGAFLYAIVTGFPPSAARAALAAAIVTGALLFRRRPDPAAVLAAVIGVVLLTAPELLWSVSLQLSAAAVLGIVRFGIPAPVPALAVRLGRQSAIRRALRRWFFLPVRISLGALLGTLPVMCYHFGACHPWTPAANLAACPLLGATLSFGGLALAVGSASSDLAHLLVVPAVLALRAILWINAVVASAPHHTVHVPPLPAWAPLVSLACFFLPRRSLAAIAATGVLALPLLLPDRPRIPEGGLALSLDRGQAVFYRRGDATVLLARGARAWELRRILRAAHIAELDLLVAARTAEDLGVRIRRVLCEPGRVQLARDLAITYSPGRTRAFSAEVRDGAVRFLFGVPRETASVPLLIGACRPLDAVACEAAAVILPDSPRELLRSPPVVGRTAVYSTEREGALHFRVRGAGWKIEPYPGQ
jgi:competence protein ComEC